MLLISLATCVSYSRNCSRHPAQGERDVVYCTWSRQWSCAVDPRGTGRCIAGATKRLAVLYQLVNGLFGPFSCLCLVACERLCTRMGHVLRLLRCMRTWRRPPWCWGWVGDQRGTCRALWNSAAPQRIQRPVHGPHRQSQAARLRSRQPITPVTAACTAPLLQGLIASGRVLCQHRAPLNTRGEVSPGEGGSASPAACAGALSG